MFCFAEQAGAFQMKESAKPRSQSHSFRATVRHSDRLRKLRACVSHEVWTPGSIIYTSKWMEKGKKLHAPALPHEGS